MSGAYGMRPLSSMDWVMVPLKKEQAISLMNYLLEPDQEGKYPAGTSFLVSTEYGAGGRCMYLSPNSLNRFDEWMKTQ